MGIAKGDGHRLKAIYLNLSELKVDREDNFWRPGFLHIIIRVFQPHIPLKKLDVTDV